MEESSSQDPEKVLTRVKADAFNLLSFRPRSVEELRRKLKLKKHPEPVIDQVLELFKKQGLLDDEKFAKLLATSGVLSKPKGRRQIEQDLKKRGLAKDLVDKALLNLKDYDEKKAARELVSGRFERMKGLSDEKKRARIFGFLKRRGFGSDVIFGVLSDLFKGVGAGESYEN